MTLGQLRRAL